MRRSILNIVLLCSCMVLAVAVEGAFAGVAPGGEKSAVAGDSSNASPPGGTKMLAANEKKNNTGWTDPEKPVTVSPGAEFTISLQSNRTTGFSWQLATPLDESLVKLVRSEYKAPQSRLQGAGGTEVWTFRATGPGQTTITLKYARPWEKDIPPSKTVVFRVISK